MLPHPATRALVCVWTACVVHEYTQGVGRRSSDAGPEHEASAYGVLIAPPALPAPPRTTLLPGPFFKPLQLGWIGAEGEIGGSQGTTPVAAAMPTDGQLKEQLRLRGLSTDGDNAALQQRLCAAIVAGESAADSHDGAGGAQ
eukprot:COSAG04_NODE_7610_length_1098_cov_1.216216_1_plen_141_part_10